MVNICLTRLIKFCGPGGAATSGSNSLQMCRWLLIALLALPEKSRNEAGERGHLAGAELDWPARRHRDETQARHLLRGIGALGGVGAQAFKESATKLLNDDSTDDIDGADQARAADNPAQYMTS